MEAQEAEARGKGKGTTRDRSEGKGKQGQARAQSHKIWLGGKLDWVGFILDLWDCTAAARDEKKDEALRLLRRFRDPLVFFKNAKRFLCLR